MPLPDVIKTSQSKYLALSSKLMLQSWQVLKKNSEQHLDSAPFLSMAAQNGGLCLLGEQLMLLNIG